MLINKDTYYVGVNDHSIDLFEGQYVVKNGISYNSYVIMDEKIVIMDTVDKNFASTWIENIKNVLKDKVPDYLVVQHMEPDHSANIMKLLESYPNITIIGNAKTFVMIKQFFNKDISNTLVVKDGEELRIGKHTLKFIFAPMVHWPEVMVTYDSYTKILFTADGFGKFGALDVKEDWADEARRYYIGIVGKYGLQVQMLLKKAASLDIEMICPLHGPVLKDNLSYYLGLYNTWSSYTPEDNDIFIAYNSIYGNTKNAVNRLIELLGVVGIKAKAKDLARTDLSYAISEAFKHKTLVIATPTYNNGLFPFTKTFIDGLLERNFQNHNIAIIENGSWAPMTAKLIKDAFANSKNITFIEPIVTIKSSLNEESTAKLCSLVDTLKEIK